MKEKPELVKENLKIIKETKEDILSKTLMIGKISKETREALNCYRDFKTWCLETGYSVSTLNRAINRYDLYELMQKETGKYLVGELPVVLISRIYKLQKQNEEKFMELAGLIDNGMDKEGVKSFLEENITEESTQFRGSELREYVEELEKEVVKMDIRRIKNSTGQKIMKAVKKVLELVSGCTKLNTTSKNRELNRNIEELNYGLGVLNIS